MSKQDEIEEGFHAVTCPECGKVYKSKNDPAKKVMCGNCGTTFHDWVYKELVGGGYDEFWRFRGRYAVVKGSRGSKKSKTIALWHIVNMYYHPDANILVVRKVERTLRDSCFSDLRWAIHRLGLDDEFKCTTNPLEIVRISTGQKILFRGMDDGLKITSITVPRGVLCWVWVEEAYEVTRESDFDVLDESIRGALPDGLFKRFSVSFNPWSDKHWLKKRFFDPPNDENKLAITTTYKNNEWLDEGDIKLFENMKQNNPTRYRVAGLGDWGVAEGLIFENWEEQDYDINEMLKIPGIKVGCGLDFGWTDPAALCCVGIDEKTKRIYVFDELYEQHLTNQELAERITEMGYRKAKIAADSADPKSIEELRQAGIVGIRPATKGKNSIIHGIQLIQNYRIIIHPQCVNFLREISNYCWDEDKSGNVIERPIDDMNHTQDALRYIVAFLVSGSRYSWN